MAIKQRNVLVLIGGYGRSGSTILEQMIESSAEKRDIKAAGELKYFKRWFLSGKRPCSCGNHMGDCTFFSGTAPYKQLEEEEQFFRLRFILFYRFYYAFNQAFRRFIDYDLKWTRNFYQLLLRENTIIDSSKEFIWSYYLLFKVKLKDVRYLHVYRHPAYVFASWRKKKPHPYEEGGYFGGYSPLKIAIEYATYNLLSFLIMFLCRGSVKINFERVITDREYLNKQLEQLPVSVSYDFHKVEVEQHTIGGNPLKFSKKRPLSQTPMPRLSFKDKFFVYIFMYPVYKLMELL